MLINISIKGVSNKASKITKTSWSYPDREYTLRDVDLAVSVAYAGGVDPETSHSTIEMRKVIAEFNAKLFNPFITEQIL